MNEEEREPGKCEKRMEPAMDGVSRGDKELCSETLRIESKLFYLDLKENSRGRYVKVSEKGNNRERSTIIVPSSGIPWFAELFHYYAGGTNESGTLVNKELPIENKVFFFDVGENPRGKFLRVSESGAGPRGRSSLIIPSGGAGLTGWSSFRDTLMRILAAECQLSGGQVPQPNELQPFQDVSVAGSQKVVGPGPSPPALVSAENGSQILRVGQKRFFVDPGANHRGQFVRITEAIGPDRNSIIVPFQALPEFQEAVRLCFEGLKLSMQDRTIGGPGTGQVGVPLENGFTAGLPNGLQNGLHHTTSSNGGLQA